MGIVPYELEAVYTVISVKQCRGGVSPPSGRETRPLRGKTNKTSNSRQIRMVRHRKSDRKSKISLSKVYHNKKQKSYAAGIGQKAADGVKYCQRLNYLLRFHRFYPPLPKPWQQNGGLFQGLCPAGKRKCEKAHRRHQRYPAKSCQRRC